ncbi:MAG: ClpXP protease specificity-enhancing factor SspB, partial [Burkholderiaceae bacterium]|nr:ClpXP protease specificity-enhancing factor SspB [Burkholderiaceae bacterium]
DRVIAIYARENGQGMAFPVSVQGATAPDASAAAAMPGVSGAAGNADTAAPGQGVADAPSARGNIQLVATTPDTSDGEPPEPSPPRPRPTFKRIK